MEEYNVFGGIIRTSSKIIMDFFNTICNISNQIKEKDPQGIPDYFDEKAKFFKDYLENGGHLYAVILDNKMYGYIKETINKFKEDRKEMNIKELTQKYGLTNSANSFDIPFYEFQNNPETIHMYLRDTDMQKFSAMLTYIDNTKNIDIKYTEDKSIDESIKNDSDKIEIYLENDKQVSIICNELIAKHIDFKMNHHKDNVGIVFEKTGKIDGKEANLEDWILNIIDQNPHLSLAEKGEIIARNEKSLNDRESTVGELKKSLEYKR